MSIIKPVVIALLGACLAATSGFARDAKSTSKPKTTASGTSAKKKKNGNGSGKSARAANKSKKTAPKTAKPRPTGLYSAQHYSFGEELPPEDLPEPEVELEDEEPTPQ